MTKTAENNLPIYNQQGFTLVELSIVLVIIGLIVGGVLAGQTLIRTAELRSVGRQIQEYTTATNTFRTKYNALPGDMRNATAIWGQAADCTLLADSGKATCNGNGNKLVDWNGVYPNRSEFFTFWQHLSNAELIGGIYDGVKGAGGYAASTVPGTNSPATRVSGGCFSFHQTGLTTLVSFPSKDNNIFVIGSLYVNGLNESDYCINGLFTPSEAADIDAKFDDGRPGTGKMKTWLPARNPNCADGSTTAANYMTAETNATCGLSVTFN